MMIKGYSVAEYPFQKTPAVIFLLVEKYFLLLNFLNKFIL